MCHQSRARRDRTPEPPKGLWTTLPAGWRRGGYSMGLGCCDAPVEILEGPRRHGRAWPVCGWCASGGARRCLAPTRTHTDVQNGTRRHWRPPRGVRRAAFRGGSNCNQLPCAGRVGAEPVGTCSACPYRDPARRYRRAALRPAITDWHVSGRQYGRFRTSWCPLDMVTVSGPSPAGVLPLGFDTAGVPAAD